MGQDGSSMSEIQPLSSSTSCGSPMSEFRSLFFSPSSRSSSPSPDSSEPGRIRFSSASEGEDGELTAIRAAIREGGASFYPVSCSSPSSSDSDMDIEVVAEVVRTSSQDPPSQDPGQGRVLRTRRPRATARSPARTRQPRQQPTVARARGRGANTVTVPASSPGPGIRGDANQNPPVSAPLPSPPTSEAATATSARGSATPRKITQHGHGTSVWECVVCLESLDAPATILQENNHGQALTIVQKNLTKIDPREICCTQCGHMYHLYCLQKWFSEQGRKTCPSCRKAAGTKLIKVFPNLVHDATPRPSQSLQTPFTSIVPSVVTAAQGGGGGAAGDNTMARHYASQTGCANPQCADLNTLHEMLMADFNQIRNQYIEIRENADISTAQVASLEERNAQLTNELEELRSSGAKRRRQR